MNLTRLACMFHTDLVSSQKDLWRSLCLHQRSLHDLELAAWEGGPLSNKIKFACVNQCMPLICWFLSFYSFKLCSRLMAGIEELAQSLRKVVDNQNVSFLDAAESAGYKMDPKDLQSVFLKKNSYSAFIELHIEQGPILEKEGIFQLISISEI